LSILTARLLLLFYSHDNQILCIFVPFVSSRHDIETAEKGIISAFFRFIVVHIVIFISFAVFVFLYSVVRWFYVSEFTAY